MIALIVFACAVLGSWSWLTFALLIPVLYLGDTACLWIHYLAVMRLKQVRDDGRLPAEAVPLATAVLYFGLLVDLLYNLTWACLVYVDVPREALVTQRLVRYKYGPDTVAWRLRLTDWFARVMLDPYDPSGIHVRQ